jgi:hypothetical protein
MATRSAQAQRFTFKLVNEQPIRFKMALTIPAPVALPFMIPVTPIKWLFSNQLLNDIA